MRLEIKKVELEVIPSTDNTILLFCRPKETATYFLYYLSDSDNFYSKCSPRLLQYG